VKWNTLYNETVDELNAERALADDFADVLATHFGFTDNAEMERVLARYREARQR
jgi:hypothetical protein